QRPLALLDFRFENLQHAVRDGDLALQLRDIDTQRFKYVVMRDAGTFGAHDGFRRGYLCFCRIGAEIGYCLIPGLQNFVPTRHGRPMPNKERKVVQIASMTGDCVMVLCDDGSLWQLQWITAHKNGSGLW